MGNIDQSRTNAPINMFARPTSSSRTGRPRHLAALAILFVGAAALHPSPIQGQSPLTPVALVLPVVAVYADDWTTTEGWTVAYDDDSELINPSVDALAQQGAAVGEAVIGLDTEWAKAKAGPDSQAQATYYIEINVSDPRGRPSVKTILDFKAAVSTSPGGGGSVLMALGANNGVPPIAWVRDDLTLAGLDLPSVAGAGRFRLVMQTGYSNEPGQGEKQFVVSQIFLNGVPINVKECWCSWMSDGGSLNLTFQPGRYLLVVIASASATGTGRALAIGDPILRPHPDNPDVVVTRLTRVGPIDRRPLSDTTPEELAALGLDPTPFSEMGFFDPPGDAPDDPPADTSAPVTSAGTSTLPNANGWHRTGVTVSLAAIDNPGGAGVKEMHIALTGASSGTQVVPGESAAAVIAAEGETTLTYYSVDQAGNQEAPQTLTVRIDATPPTLGGLPGSDCSIWPPDHRLVSVATVWASDALSGPAGALVVLGTSNEPATGLGSGDLAPDVVITNNVVQLRAERSGTGPGRVYTITASASDLAGNQTTASATCTVPRDVKTPSN